MATVRLVVELIRDDGKFFYLPYDEVRPFSEKRAAVKKGNLWGFIDENGNEMVKPIFKVVRNFKNGRAAVLTDNNRYMYIDSIGIPLCEPKYSSAGDFSKDGYAEVSREGVTSSTFNGTSALKALYIDYDFNEYDTPLTFNKR